MTDATSPRHVAVIGAGIVGVATAIWLQRDGRRVTLIDRAGPGDGASFGNGGILASCAMVPVTGPGLLKKAPGMLMDRDQPLFLKWGYLPRLLPWLRQYLSHANEVDTRRISAAIAGMVGDSVAEHQALSQGTAAEKWVVPCDYLYIYKDRAAFEGDALAWDIRRGHGITWDELEGAAFRAYDRAFSPDQSFAVRMGDHGRITDPGKYVKALAAHVEDEGGEGGLEVVGRAGLVGVGEGGGAEHDGFGAGLGVEVVVVVRALVECGQREAGLVAAEADAEPVAEPEPVAEAPMEPAPEPEAEAEPAPEPEPEPVAAEPVAEEPKKPKRRGWWSLGRS